MLVGGMTPERGVRPPGRLPFPHLLFRCLSFHRKSLSPCTTFVGISGEATSP